MTIGSGNSFDRSSAIRSKACEVKRMVNGTAIATLTRNFFLTERSVEIDAQSPGLPVRLCQGKFWVHAELFMVPGPLENAERTVKRLQQQYAHELVRKGQPRDR